MKIDERCTVIAALITALRPFYLTASNGQQAFLETIVGAGIWYIPKDENAWTGLVSVALLRDFHPESGVAKPKASEEHVHPRKITARQLFQNQSLDLANVATHFREQYGKVYYITSAENKTVTRDQRAEVFSSPDAAYQTARIEFVRVDPKHWTKIRKRDRDTIDSYLAGSSSNGSAP